MKSLIITILTCPLLLISGGTFAINQDIQNLQSSLQAQEQINALRQPYGELLQQDVPVVHGYPAVSPEMLYDYGPDRYTSPDGMYIDMEAKPAEPFGPVAVPGPFRPDTLNP